MTWVDLPFLSATRRSIYPETSQAVHSEHLATVRVLIAENTRQQKQLIVEVDSDHMHPRLREGDWLRCLSIPYEGWSYLPAGVYVVQTQGHFLIRRVKNNDLEQHQVLTMHADNPHTEGEMEVPQAHLNQVWQVLEIVSGSIR